MSLTSKRLISQSLVANKSTYRTPNFDDVLKENNDPDKGRSYAYFMVGAMAVSYTHLDVYKRQLHE